MSLTVVMPSRGRPKRAYEAIGAIRETAVLVSTNVILAVDEDDPEWAGYASLTWRLPYAASVHLVTLRPEETGNLVRATNTVSMRVAAAEPHGIIANFGDDHMARTPGWDRIVTEALATPGIAYGDDGIQGEDLPTAPFISAEIVNALGYYALPDVTHLFCDNAWRDVGAQTGTLRYLPGIAIEHMHPYAGKAPWDDGYIRANSESASHADRMHYESWRENAMVTDIARVRDALAESAA